MDLRLLNLDELWVDLLAVNFKRTCIIDSNSFYYLVANHFHDRLVVCPKGWVELLNVRQIDRYQNGVLLFFAGLHLRLSAVNHVVNGLGLMMVLMLFEVVDQFDPARLLGLECRLIVLYHITLLCHLRELHKIICSELEQVILYIDLVKEKFVEIILAKVEHSGRVHNVDPKLKIQNTRDTENGFSSS